MDVQRWEWALHFEWVLMKTFSINHGVLPWNLSIIILFFKSLIRWINLSLEFSLKVIRGILIFIGESKHLILNGSQLKISQFIMVFLLELYQFFFLVFKTLIRWRKLSLEFSIKVIFRRWMFGGDSRHLIFNVLWWEHVWFFY